MKSNRIPGVLVVGSLAAIGGASASLGGAPFALVGIIIGALWGWGLMAITKRIARSERRLRLWSNGILFVTVLFTAVVAGASFMGQLLSSAALNSHPQFFADMIRGSIGAAEALPFYLLNTPLEWFLMPMALLLNWQNPRRRSLLVTTLIIWTAHRTWTYLFFVPQITDWSKGTAPFTADQLTHVREWVNLSWVRQLVDDVTAVLILTATFMRPDKSRQK